VRFVLASLNPDKRRELLELLALPGVELVSLADFPGATAPEENGATLRENALLKARAAVALTKLPALADDTGLEVEALEGRPGVHAARYAGRRATYAENVKKLLAELAGVPAAGRGARFRAVIAAVWPDGIEITADGALEGRITEAARGGGGFGYDPVFEVAASGRTLAELGAKEKNAISHRARAAQALAAMLKARLEG
jgi:XTP/dITP diphosphohydrolase